MKLINSFKNFLFPSDNLNNGSWIELGSLCNTIITKNTPRPDFKKMGIYSHEAELLHPKIWEYNGIQSNDLVVKHVLSGSKLRIPESSVCLFFDSKTNRKNISISNINEFIIKETFSDFKKFLRLIGMDSMDFKKLNNKQNTMKSHLGFFDRGELTAPGTRVLCYFSEKPRVMGRAVTCFPGMTSETARILALWFNSSFGILQHIINRNPQRGGFYQYHSSELRKLLVPNPTKLSTNQKNQLITLYNETKNIEFPCIIEQFARLVDNSTFDVALISRLFDEETTNVVGSGFPERINLDERLISILDFPKNIYTHNLDKNLYPKLINELIILKQLML